MKIGQKLYVTNRKDWRSWLSKNHAKKSEIWLIYYKKDSSKPRIEYNAAVEEALSYGWIDGIVKSIDSKKYVQRFSPRKPNSNLSQPNIERLKKLERQGKLTRAGRAAVAHAYNVKKTSRARDSVAPDILRAIKANKPAWQNYKKLPRSYRQVRLAYIESQRRHGKEYFTVALNNFVKKTAANKRFGILKL